MGLMQTASYLHMGIVSPINDKAVQVVEEMVEKFTCLMQIAE
jgi:hypothetical protein